MPKSNEIREDMNNSNVLSTSSHETANLVTVFNHTAVTTSLIIAEYFEKRHCDVLRQIHLLISLNAKLRSAFESDSYLDSTGKANPMYYITRDGFTLLAMGFTGQKAMAFKIAYIEAFNAMEERLRKGDAQRMAKEVLRQQMEKVNKALDGVKNGNGYLPHGDLFPHIPYSDDWDYQYAMELIFSVVRNAYLDGMSASYKLAQAREQLDALRREIPRIMGLLKEV